MQYIEKELTQSESFPLLQLGNNFESTGAILPIDRLATDSPIIFSFRIKRSIF